MPEKFSRNALTIAAATLATGALAYVIYFDYKRRNDAQFRRKLRKEKKRVNKAAAQEAKESSGSTPGSLPTNGNITPEVLRVAYDQALRDEPPTSVEEREAYFMTQVGMGEQLVAQGPAFFLQAAIGFYKALRIYPNALELLAIYEKTVPQPVLKLIIELHNMDVSTSPFAQSKPKSSEEKVEVEEEVDIETSPTRSGPPSETSSQEWDKLSNPDPTS